MNIPPVFPLWQTRFPDLTKSFRALLIVFGLTFKIAANSLIGAILSPAS